MPGMLRFCFNETRIAGEQNLKVDMGTWMMIHHECSIKDEEYTKYLKIFKTLDQK
jgi:hypothetical protein